MSMMNIMIWMVSDNPSHKAIDMKQKILNGLMPEQKISHHEQRTITMG